MIALQPAPHSLLPAWPTPAEWQKKRRRKRYRATRWALQQLAGRHRFAMTALGDAQRAVDQHWPRSRRPRELYARSRCVLTTAAILRHVRLWPGTTYNELCQTLTHQRAIKALVAAGLVRRTARGPWRTLHAVEG